MGDNREKPGDRGYPPAVRSVLQAITQINLPTWVGKLFQREELREDLRGFGRWSLIMPVVLLILFASGQMALMRPPVVAAGDTGSQMRADYSPWENTSFVPVIMEIISEIQADHGGFDVRLVIPGDYWPGKSQVRQEPSPSPPRATPVALQASSTPSSIPTESQLPYLETATPHVPQATSTSIATPTPIPTNSFQVTPNTHPTGTPTRLPHKQPTSTSTPTNTQTQTPTATQTNMPSATVTQTATLPPPTPTDTLTVSPSATEKTPGTPTETPVPPATATNTPVGTPSPTSSSTPTLPSTPTNTPTRTVSPTPRGTGDPAETIMPTPTATYTPTPITPVPVDTPIPLPPPNNVVKRHPHRNFRGIGSRGDAAAHQGSQTWVDTFVYYEFFDPDGCGGDICLGLMKNNLSPTYNTPGAQNSSRDDTIGSSEGSMPIPAPPVRRDPFQAGSIEVLP